MRTKSFGWKERCRNGMQTYGAKKSTASIIKKSASSSRPLHAHYLDKIKDVSHGNAFVLFLCHISIQPTKLIIVLIIMSSIINNSSSSINMTTTTITTTTTTNNNNNNNSSSNSSSISSSSSSSSSNSNNNNYNYNNNDGHDKSKKGAKNDITYHQILTH
ncbi:hypothetical protein PoB_004163000 [Plakobranchus ocellatus]|uniref:Uncharacterized protein n=1 Tax=Plakobranchus ocellatus TaxID=259542 RepID=A0AAV4B695_9GAST|nr:hypothetical protein PoB_004163000 [Plakobranchus ocellatus]